MKITRIGVALLAVAALLGGCATPKGESVAEKRSYVKQMRDQALADFYHEDPSLREKVRRAPGYAVFSDVKVGVLLLGAGHGFGLAHDNRTGRDVYMRMAQVGVGVGMGARDLRALYVFRDAGTFQTFVERGWEFGADANAAAIAGGDKGVAAGATGAASASGVSAGLGGSGGAGERSGGAGGAAGSGIEVYQITENGLALRASVGGTKYWKDGQLN
jgi:lipid-binding SYLF domain-containing protein